MEKIKEMHRKTLRDLDDTENEIMSLRQHISINKPAGDRISFKDEELEC